MASKPSPIRSSAASALRNSRNDGDGNTVHNKILLGIPNKALPPLQFGMLTYRFGLEDEAAFLDYFVVELQPVQNRIEAV
jgi:hypothetical protein